MRHDSSIHARCVRVGAVSTRVLEVAGDGPPIVLLHGFTDSADTWRPVLRELAVRGRRAVAVDLPGAGHADPLPDAVASHYDAFVDALIDTFGDGGVLAVGNSLGALLAMRAAGRDVEERILGVVGLGPAGIEYGWRLRAIGRVLPSLHPFLRPFDHLPVPACAIRHAAACYHARMLASGIGDPEPARQYARHIHGMRGLARIRRDMVAIGRELPVDPTMGSRISVPIRLVWGRQDRLTDVRGAAAFLATTSAASLEILENCGHCPQLEHAGRVADLIVSAPMFDRATAVPG